MSFHAGRSDLDSNAKDKIRDYYDDYWSSGYNRREKVMARWWAPAFDYLYDGLGDIAGRRVVEIGAGDGSNASRLCAMGADLFAVDFSAQSVRAIRRRAVSADMSVTPVRADAHELPFSNNSMDAAIITNTIMFLDKKKALAECRRVVRPGGIVALIEPLRYPHIIMLARLFESHFWKIKFRFLTIGELMELGSLFSGFSHREFFLLSSFAVIAARVFPASSAILKSLDLFSQLDTSILDRIRFLRNFCYLTVSHFRV